MTTSSRKQLNGTVVSTKATKTIVVNVTTHIKHPLYGKRVLSTKNFATHDEKELAKKGDKVLIAETRPFSKTKKFRLVKILETIKDDK